MSVYVHLPHSFKGLYDIYGVYVPQIFKGRFSGVSESGSLGQGQTTCHFSQPFAGMIYMQMSEKRCISAFHRHRRGSRVWVCAACRLGGLPQRCVGGGASGPKQVQPDAAHHWRSRGSCQAEPAESAGLTLKCPRCSGKLSGELLAPGAGDNNCIENSREAEGL